MSEDMDRRERAEKCVLSGGWKRSYEIYKWTRSFSDNAMQQGFLHGYLAGAREEEKIKDAEIKDKVNEFIEAASHHHLVEEKLKAQLAEQAETIRDLTDTIAEMGVTLAERTNSLETAINDFLCECALVEKLRKYETYQITTGSMDELRKAVD